MSVDNLLDHPAEAFELLEWWLADKYELEPNELRHGAKERHIPPHLRTWVDYWIHVGWMDRRPSLTLSGPAELALKLRSSEQAATTASTATTPAKIDQVASTQTKVSLDARALAVFIEHPDWTKVKIADHLGCAEKSLAPKKCPRLAAAIAAYKSRGDAPRGRKDSQGNLEAWDEE